MYFFMKEGGYQAKSYFLMLTARGKGLKPDIMIEVSHPIYIPADVAVPK